MQKRERPLLTIRMNAETDSVTVDGVEYDRSRMKKEEKYLMRRVIVSTLFPRGR
jgi:hypothetical protein